MQDAIKRKRRQAILSAAVSAGFQLVSAVLFIWVRSLPQMAGWPQMLLLVCAVADILLLLPLAVSLKQRLHEIQGGEEYEASQY